MKRILKQGFLAMLTMLFLLFGLFMSTERVAAQAGLTGGITVPKENIVWKTNPDAIQALTNEIDFTWRPALNLNPFNWNAVRHANYYEEAIKLLALGENVGDALIKAIPMAGKSGSDNEVPNTTKAVLQALYDEASGLLRQ